MPKNGFENGPVVVLEKLVALAQFEPGTQQLRVIVCQHSIIYFSLRSLCSNSHRFALIYLGLLCLISFMVFNKDDLNLAAKRVCVPQTGKFSIVNLSSGKLSR